MVGYIFGGNTGTSYDALQQRRKLADALAAQVMGITPKNTGEGIGAVLKGIGAGIGRYRANKAIDAGSTAANSAYDNIFSSLMGGGAAQVGNGGQTIPTPSGSDISLTPSGANGGPSAYRDAIASIESAGSGDYSAIGPTNPKLGRALGRYQIMEANIGPWSREALGREVTPDEFLANPQIQDAVFDKKFGGYVDKFGPTGAAQAWFAGPGGVGKLDRKDSLGTSVSAYANKFDRALGGQQVASLDPSAGMPPNGAAAIEQAAPGSGYVDPQVTTGNRAPAPMPPPQTESLQPQGGAGGALPTQPSTNVAPAPQVASVPPVAPQQPPQQVAQAGLFGGVDPNLLQLMSNPFLDEDKKAAVKMLIQQQMQQADNAQQEQTWRSRQDYERQQQQGDPLRQAQIAEANARAKSLGTPTRPITAEERTQWGIPATDTRPYAMTATGPELIGGGGQTINIDSQVEARKGVAAKIGLTPDDPRYMGFLATGDLPKENQQNLTAIDKKAIQDADDMVSANSNAIDALKQAEALSDQANSGWFASTRASIGNNLPDMMVPDWMSSPESSQATSDMDNAIIGQAITQLKTIFGGNPTEGERNILLDLQGSSSMPRSVRKEVFARAQALAEKRLKFNQDRANDLRGGNYYKPDRGGSQAPAGPSVDDLLKKYGGQ